MCINLNSLKYQHLQTLQLYKKGIRKISLVFIYVSPVHLTESTELVKDIRPLCVGIREWLTVFLTSLDSSVVGFKLFSVLYWGTIHRQESNIHNRVGLTHCHVSNVVIVFGYGTTKVNSVVGLLRFLFPVVQTCALELNFTWDEPNRLTFGL